MRSQVAAFEAPLHSPGSEPELGDLRFRALMREADWAALPLADPPALLQAPRRRRYRRSMSAR